VSMWLFTFFVVNTLNRIKMHVVGRQDDSELPIG
jgi:hypothetical protein